MPRHDDRVRVQHMLDHAREAAEMAQGRTRADLDRDRKLNLAMVRLLEIVGEAAARVTDSFREQYPDVPWRDIADFRNRVIHGYDTVDFDRVWRIVQDELPPADRGTPPHRAGRRRMNRCTVHGSRFTVHPLTLSLPGAAGGAVGIPVPPEV